MMLPPSLIRGSARRATSQQGIGADLHRLQIAGARGLDGPAAQILTICEGDRMHQKVELAPGSDDLLEQGVDLIFLAHVEGLDDRSLTDSASGRTRRSRASPRKVKPSSAPSAWARLAIPQAIERWLATPMIRPFLPARSPCPSRLSFTLAHALSPDDDLRPSPAFGYSRASSPTPQVPGDSLAPRLRPFVGLWLSLTRTSRDALVG